MSTLSLVRALRRESQRLATSAFMSREPTKAQAKILDRLGVNARNVVDDGNGTRPVRVVTRMKGFTVVFRPRAVRRGIGPDWVQSAYLRVTR